MSSPNNIVLVGFMGTGKSSVGRLLASKLGHRFVDTDALIVERFGAPIADIFKIHGEEYFRDLETAALESLREVHRRIIATGGGIVTRPKNGALLRNCGVVVWLTADEETIFKRVSRNQARPLLQTANPRAAISELLTLRNPLYESVAQFRIDTTALSHEAIAEQIIQHRLLNSED